jgi:hypothetical protein
MLESAHMVSSKYKISFVTTYNAFKVSIDGTYRYFTFLPKQLNRFIHSNFLAPFSLISCHAS